MGVRFILMGTRTTADNAGFHAIRERAVRRALAVAGERVLTARVDKPVAVPSVLI